MYSLGVLAKDRVVKLDDVPQSSIGAPCPMIVADEHSLVVAFYLEDRPEDWDGKTVRVIDPTESAEPYALVSFERVYAHYSGAPNDEAFKGHPLTTRGLKPYGAFEIKHSTWRHQLMVMNRVHAHHEDSRFEALSHFILSFHDSVFECIAKGYSVSTGHGLLAEAVKDHLNQIHDGRG